MDTLVEDLSARARTDQLTGLLNKVTYETTVREMIEAKQAQGIFGYLILDVDRFKNINDRFGHVRGDEVLKQMGSTIRDC